MSTFPGNAVELSEPRAAFTPRQGQVVALLLEGHGEKQVARILGLSVHTVHTHVKRIYTRCDVTSRCELIVAVLRGQLGREILSSSLANFGGDQ